MKKFIRITLKAMMKTVIIIMTIVDKEGENQADQDTPL